MGGGNKSKNYTKSRETVITPTPNDLHDDEITATTLTITDAKSWSPPPNNPAMGFLNHVFIGKPSLLWVHGKIVEQTDTSITVQFGEGTPTCFTKMYTSLTQLFEWKDELLEIAVGAKAKRRRDTRIPPLNAKQDILTSDADEESSDEEEESSEDDGGEDYNRDNKLVEGEEEDDDDNLSPEDDGMEGEEEEEEHQKLNSKRKSNKKDRESQLPAKKPKTTPKPSTTTKTKQPTIADGANTGCPKCIDQKATGKKTRKQHAVTCPLSARFQSNASALESATDGVGDQANTRKRSLEEIHAQDGAVDSNVDNDDLAAASSAAASAAVGGGGGGVTAAASAGGSKRLRRAASTMGIGMDDSNASQSGITPSSSSGSLRRGVGGGVGVGGGGAIASGGGLLFQDSGSSSAADVSIEDTVRNTSQSLAEDRYSMISNFHDMKTGEYNKEAQRAVNDIQNVIFPKLEEVVSKQKQEHLDDLDSDRQAVNSLVPKAKKSTTREGLIKLSSDLELEQKKVSKEYELQLHNEKARLATAITEEVKLQETWRFDPTSAVLTALALLVLGMVVGH